MSDQEQNSAAAGLAQHDEGTHLARENASLRAQLAALQRANVVEGRFVGEMPRYRLNEPGYYDDTYFETGSVIDFTDPPNLTMVPMNEPARRALEGQIALQTEGARRVAMRSGRDFFGLVTDRNVLIETAMMDAKAKAEVPVPVIAMPTVRGEVPPMPHTEEAKAAARRGPGRPRKVQAVPQAALTAADRGSPMLAEAPAPPRADQFPRADQIEPAIVGRRVS